ncbi:MAG: hypothetical protein ACK52I_32395, partial [Pseudomonadota bacterium]
MRLRTWHRLLRRKIRRDPDPGGEQRDPAHGRLELTAAARASMAAPRAAPPARAHTGRPPRT